MPLYHAKDDTTVSWRQTEMLFKALKGKGCDVEMRLDEEGGHSGVLVDFMLWNNDDGRLLPLASD